MSEQFDIEKHSLVVNMIYEDEVYPDVKQLAQEHIPKGEYSGKEAYRILNNVIFAHHFEKIVELIDETVDFGTYRILFSLLNSFFRNYFANIEKPFNEMDDDEQQTYTFGTQLIDGLPVLLELMTEIELPLQQEKNDKSILYLLAHTLALVSVMNISNQLHHINKYLGEESTPKVVIDYNREPFYSLLSNPPAFSSKYNQAIDNFSKRITETQTYFNDFFSINPLNIYNVDFFEQQLDPILQNGLGISYAELVETLKTIIDNPQKNGVLPTEMLYERYKNLLNVDEETFMRIIKGFTVYRDNPDNSLDTEDSRFTNPERENDFFTRGFFQVSVKEKGQLLFFETPKARQTFYELPKHFLFQKYWPEEWGGNKKDINKALNSLQQEAGNWFEKEMAEQLQKLFGFTGRSFNRVIGDRSRGDGFITIPTEVGEIDYLGYAPVQGLLYLLELKMVQGRATPKSTMKDLDKFIFSKQNYSAQLHRKAEWIRTNSNEVINAMQNLHEFNGVNIRPKGITISLVTFYPTFVEGFFDTDTYPYNFTSAVHFLKSLQESNGEWPFKFGLLNL